MLSTKSCPLFKISFTKSLSSQSLQLIFTFRKAPSTAVRAHNAPTPASVTEFGFQTRP